jgi:hypothetical protein
MGYFKKLAIRIHERRRRRGKRMGKFSRRVDPQDEPVEGKGWPASTDDAASWPTLVEFIGCERYEDGKKRVPGTVLLFADGGRLKVLFKDKDGKRVAFDTLEGLETVLDALERKLAGDDLDWREDRPTTARRN